MKQAIMHASKQEINKQARIQTIKQADKQTHKQNVFAPYFVLAPLIWLLGAPKKECFVPPEYDPSVSAHDILSPARDPHAGLILAASPIDLQHVVPAQGGCNTFFCKCKTS